MPTASASSARPAGRAEVVEVAGRPVVAFEPLVGRVRSALVLHPLGRLTDVSGQPGAIEATLRDSVDRSGRSHPQAVEAARRALDRAVVAADAWHAPDDADLVVALGGAALPLLGAGYDAGVRPVRDVPAWARPVLAATDVRRAARAAFGSSATRPVVRALAACLSPSTTGTPGFGVLALALVGAAVLSPDALARVLAADRADHPVADLPDRSTIEATGRIAARWGAHRTERVLRTAAVRPDGVGLVVRTARYHRDLQPHVPTRLPNDLDGLHDRLRARIATAAEGRPAVAPLPARARARPRNPIHGPPPARAEVTAATPIPMSRAVRSLVGQTVDGLEWVVPRTVGDLNRWGGILSNCLDEFGPAAAEGRATILGLLRGDQLRYALEVTPDGTIRQLVGPANRPAERWVRGAVVAGLGRAGIIDPSRPANAVWLRE